MRIRCENCHHEFQYDPPYGGEAARFVPCPDCEFPNATPGSGGSSGPAETVYTQCFNCGRQMVQDASHAIPICKNCQEGEEQASSAKEWMVKKLSGQIYGPFDAETIQTWIETSKIDPKDEVAKVGGQWKKFEAHPTFSRLFSGGPGPAVAAPAVASPTPVKAAPAASAQPAYKPITDKKPRKPINWRAILTNGGAVLGSAAVLGGAYYLFNAGMLVVPESWISAGSETLKEQVGERLAADEKKVSGIEQAFQAILAKLKEANPKVEEPSVLLFLRGRAAFLHNTDNSLRLGKTLLEKAVVADPHNELAIAALAELYAAIGEPALLRDALQLVDEADRLNRGSAEVLRARAAIGNSLHRAADAQTHAQTILTTNASDPEAEYYLGSSYLETSPPDYAQALSHLEKSISLDNQFHKAYHQLGVVYLATNQYAKAADALNRTLKLDPRDERALGDYAKLLEEVGDANGALDVFRKALASGGDEIPLVKMQYAVLLYQSQGELRQSGQLLSSIVPKEGSSPLSLASQKEALVHLATIQRLGGAPQQALATVDRVLAIDDNFAPALFQKGLAHFALNQLDEAGKSLRAAGTAINNQKEVEADIKFYLSQILAAQNKMKEAVDELEDAIEDFKFHPRYRLALAQTFVKLGQVDEALNVIRETGKLDPHYMNNRGGRTLYFHRPPSPASSAPLFKQAFAEKDYMAEPWIGQGMVQLTVGNLGAARQALQQAVEANERSSYALLQLGMLAAEHGDARGAIGYLTRSIENDSQNGLAYIYLGRAYMATGQLKEAASTFEKAQRYDRVNPVLLTSMGELQARQGDTDGARKSFAKAIEQDARYIPPRRDLYQKVP